MYRSSSLLLSRIVLYMLSIRTAVVSETLMLAVCSCFRVLVFDHARPAELCGV